MTYVRANLFIERESWKRPLVVSAGFHVLVTVTLLVLAFIMGPRGGSQWGENQGEAVAVQMVSGVPLPRPAEPTENIVANESKGVTQTLPQTKPIETEDGISIPGKKPTPKPQKAVTAANVPPRLMPTPTPQTAVPYGEGGPVSGPYGAFAATNTKGGFSFQNGDFGTRFSWYVRQINDKVSSVWYQTEIDPRVASSKRVYLTFDIQRDGKPANVRMEQSSGIPSLDRSAMWALQRIDTFGPLPREYSGSTLSVEFWFDYQR
ncbi:MAG TPA: TonB family protein [Candidatus Angelobacter sp.]|nr:TonB family protein [Candidatus Angelobacter sp.]